MMSFTYFSRFVMSALLDSIAFSIVLETFYFILFVYTTVLLSRFKSNSVLSKKIAYITLMLSLNTTTCFVLIHFFTYTI